MTVRADFMKRVRDAWCLTPEEAKQISYEDYAEDMETLEWELGQEAHNARQLVELDEALKRRQQPPLEPKEQG